MKVFHGFDEVKSIKNPVVTTGSFDGVHIGHKTILNRLKMLAEKYQGESVLITFDPHPRKVLYPETAGKNLRLINSQEEKLDLLEKAGLDNLIIVEFTKEFSRITSEEFVRDFLHGRLHAKVIVAGFNHHFGFNQEGDYKQLWQWQEKYDFEAEEIPEQEVAHETVSSTRIRQAISEGYMQRANAYLDHYYIIIGKPEKVDIYTPTHQHTPSTDQPISPSTQLAFMFLKVPLTDECKILPSPGIYAVSAENGNCCYSKGMVIINRNSDNKSEVLLHLFENIGCDHSGRLIISFHKKIHGSVNFSDEKSIPRIKSSREEIEELIY